MSESEELRRINRKLLSIFYGAQTPPEDAISGLGVTRSPHASHTVTSATTDMRAASSPHAGDPRLRDKVLAYAPSFAQQFLKLNRVDTANELLEAYTRYGPAPSATVARAATPPARAATLPQWAEGRLPR